MMASARNLREITTVGPMLDDKFQVEGALNLWSCPEANDDEPMD